MRVSLPAPAIICLVTILFLAPFVNKAFHIDDPLFVWAAQQIQKHPLDPYGFQLNWNDRPEMMWQVTKNPPLDCYYIAAVASLTGYREIPLHIAFWLPACLVTLGTYVLAKRFVQRPLWAAFLALITPAFWVSATSVMCDVWMTACCVWAVIYWFKAVDENKASLYGLVGLLVGVGALFKYFAVCLLAIFFVHGILRRIHPLKAAATFLLPVLLLVGYELWTKSLYGTGMITEAMRWSGNARQFYFSGRTMQFAVATIYLGGCILPLGWLALFSANRKTVPILVLVGAGLLGGICFMSSREAADLYKTDFSPPQVWLHAFFFLVMSVALIWAIMSAAKSRWQDAKTDLSVLLLWTALAFIFVAQFNWVVNARVLLPLVPPAAILTQMALERTAALNWSRFRFAATLTPAVLLALAVNVGDYQLAEAGRTMPDVIKQYYGGSFKRTYFMTHWGFQYYMQLAGALPLDKKLLVEAVTGDVIVQPTQGAASIVLSPNPDIPRKTFKPDRLPVASTCGAQEYFYASFGRVLPFRYGVGHGQDFEVFRVP